jgi:hypothetical protein
MTAHARLSPSAADAWMNCPGYPNAIEGLPNDSSEAAAEGTVAHGVSDLCLTYGLDAHNFIGARANCEGFDFEWTEDDADLLQPGLDQVRAFGGEFFGEHKVDLSRWLGDNQFGTLDRGIILPDLIVLGDLKWGRGVPVSPINLKQLKAYALGFWDNIARHRTDAVDFLFIIDQPRCSAGGGEWRTTLAELLVFGDEMAVAAAKTHDPDAPRIASEKGCFWCLRRQAPGGCAAYDAFNVALIDAKFEDFDDTDPPSLTPTRELTPARRSYILQHRAMFETWLEDLHLDAVNDFMAGRPVPGRKVVPGKLGPRKFIDRDAAVAELTPKIGGALFAAPKPKTPTQLEKDLGLDDYIEHVAPLVTRAAGKPVLVDEADSRAPIETAQGKFDDDNEGE